MNLVSNYKNIKKINKLKSNSCDYDELSNDDIQKLLRYCYRNKDFDNFMYLVTILSKKRKIELSKVLYEYVFKFNEINKNYSIAISLLISDVLSLGDIKNILNKLYNEDIIEKNNLHEKNNLYLFGCSVIREDNEEIFNCFMKKLSCYDNSIGELISYLEALKSSNLLNFEHVSLVAEKVINDENIDLKVKFVRKFEEWISKNDMTDLIESVIETNDCSKMLYISTCLSKRDDLFIKLGYSICALGNAEFIYHFVNQHYNNLLKDEIEYFKICLLQTKNDIWIMYYALAHDISIIRDYYGGAEKLFKKINFSSDIKPEAKEKINKLILENEELSKEIFK